MKEVFFKNQDLLWADVLENKISVDTLLDYMADQGYNATTDYPGCLFYEEYFRRYPDAKVILSVRDSAEGMYSLLSLHNILHYMYREKEWCIYAYSYLYM
jgi:hypothetical protein